VAGSARGVAVMVNRWSPEQVEAWVERSASAQGVAVRVRDVRVVEAVASLLVEGREPVLEAPGGVEPVGVEGVASSDGRVDGDVVEDRFDDGALAGEGQVRPGIPEGL